MKTILTLLLITILVSCKQQPKQPILDLPEEFRYSDSSDVFNCKLQDDTFRVNFSHHKDFVHLRDYQLDIHIDTIKIYDNKRFVGECSKYCDIELLILRDNI